MPNIAKAFDTECCAQHAVERLKKTILPWQENSSHPAGNLRKTGMGEEVARIDRRCGGYQNPHFPLMIGWKVMFSQNGGSSGYSGVVMIDYPKGFDPENTSMKTIDNRDAFKAEAAVIQALEEAVEKADSHLIRLVQSKRQGTRILGLKVIEETDCPHCGQPMCDDETCS
jgi:hypothetical protein